MERKIKRLFYVKREVMATTIREAMNAKGKIYEIVMAEDKSEASKEILNPVKGFKP